MFIWERLLNSSQDTNGPPPENPRQARDYYTNLLRLTLDFAKHSDFVPESIGNLVDGETSLSFPSQIPPIYCFPENFRILTVKIGPGELFPTTSMGFTNSLLRSNNGYMDGQEFFLNAENEFMNDPNYFQEGTDRI